jgi:hemoglobin-like flavoprotein
MTDTAHALVAPDPTADSALLRASFAAAASDPVAFADAFYTRLFTLAPAARELFHADIGMQREKFAQTLGTVVAFLDAPETLVPELRRLGARHVGYGTLPLHYALVGEALLDTLAMASPDGLDRNARAAWHRLYGWIVSEMLAGAQGKPA